MCGDKPVKHDTIPFQFKIFCNNIMHFSQHLPATIPVLHPHHFTGLAPRTSAPSGARFRILHFRTAHRMRFCNFKSETLHRMNYFYMINFKKILQVFYALPIKPKRISTKGTGMKIRFIHTLDGSIICLAL